MMAIRGCATPARCTEPRTPRTDTPSAVNYAALPLFLFLPKWRSNLVRDWLLMTPSRVMRVSLPSEPGDSCRVGSEMCSPFSRESNHSSIRRSPCDSSNLHP
jgi:hypothetical protein